MRRAPRAREDRHWRRRAARRSAPPARRDRRPTARPRAPPRRRARRRCASPARARSAPVRWPRRDEGDVVDGVAADAVDEVADILRAPRESAATEFDLDVDRPARGEGSVQGPRALRLDADDADAARKPARDAGDQPAAADRDEDRVEGRAVLLPFEADGALARDRRLGVEGMHAQRAALRHVGVAGLLRIGVAGAADDDLGPVRADDRDLRRARDLAARRCAPGCRAGPPPGRPRRRDCRPRRPRRRRRERAGDRSVLKAPRALKEPACCRNSSFRLTGPSWPKAPGTVQERRAPDMGRDARMRRLRSPRG